MEHKDFVENLFNSAVIVAYPWVKRLVWDDETEVVTVVCQNGYTYTVNCALDSNSGIMVDVMRVLSSHN